jgi:hypothetical protein
VLSFDLLKLFPKPLKIFVEEKQTHEEQNAASYICFYSTIHSAFNLLNESVYRFRSLQ